MRAFTNVWQTVYIVCIEKSFLYRQTARRVGYDEGEREKKYENLLKHLSLSFESSKCVNEEEFRKS